MRRTIERGSHKCDERRRARILTYAPTFGRHGSKAYLDRLVKQAVEGNAWHAGGLTSLLTPHAWYNIAHQLLRAACGHMLCVCLSLKERAAQQCMGSACA